MPVHIHTNSFSITMLDVMLGVKCIISRMDDALQSLVGFIVLQAMPFKLN